MFIPLFGSLAIDTEVCGTRTLRCEVVPQFGAVSVHWFADFLDDDRRSPVVPSSSVSIPRKSAVLLLHKSLQFILRVFFFSVLIVDPGMDLTSLACVT